MQNAITSGSILLIDADQDRNAPQDINDYLGRLVRCYDTVFTVVRVEPSTRVARKEGDDGRPVGRWIEADTVAAPGRTVLCWDYRTDYREASATCESLYQTATAAEQQRAEERRVAEEKRRDEETCCEGMWKEFTPEWAKGYLIAEYHEDTSDVQTDYFAYRVTETVFLGFSKSDRNNFSEMRKLAATFPETAHLAGSEGVEHRENYSGGGGYYLGGDCGALFRVGYPQAQPQVRSAPGRQRRGRLFPLDSEPLNRKAPGQCHMAGGAYPQKDHHHADHHAHHARFSPRL